MRALVCASTLLLGSATVTAEGLVNERPEKPVFKEIWGYLMRGGEGGLSGAEPITDICYVGVNLTLDGRIADKIRRPQIALQNGAKPRVHLVVAELSNSSLLHFSLDPQYGVRPLLVDDIVRVSSDFDGVQIDFESVSRGDSESFYGFLQELRSRLPPEKTLSVAVPARTQTIDDAYVYSRIASIADRIVVMAYDEHWSTSAPGPVASLPWCARVADYAVAAVGSSKVIMGLPLYGRAWQDKQLARALPFQSVEDIVADKQSETSYASELGPYFEYSENVVVKVFYDDVRSILDKLRLYRSKNVNAVSFWRIGLGPADLWSDIDGSDAAGDAPSAADIGPAATNKAGAVSR